MPDAVSAFYRTTGTTAEYYVTGPIPRDSFLVAIHNTVRCSSIGTFNVGHVLITGQDNNAAAWTGGRRLLQRSSLLTLGQPNMSFGAPTNAATTWVQPVNQAIQAYPSYVLTRVLFAVLAQTLSILTTLDLLTLDEVSRLWGPTRPVSIVAPPRPHGTIQASPAAPHHRG